MSSKSLDCSSQSTLTTAQRRTLLHAVGEQLLLLPVIRGPYHSHSTQNPGWTRKPCLPLLYLVLITILVGSPVRVALRQCSDQISIPHKSLQEQENPKLNKSPFCYVDFLCPFLTLSTALFRNIHLTLGSNNLSPNRDCRSKRVDEIPLLHYYKRKIDTIFTYRHCTYHR